MKKIIKSILTLALGLMSLSAWGVSNYCNYPSSTDPDYNMFRKDNKSVVFSWNTADNGDVIVTIAPGDDATTASFRDDGFENDITKFTVLSGENFVTEEPASKYFYEERTIGTVNDYILYRTGSYNLPSPCKIKFAGANVAWKVDGDNRWDMLTFTYDYGTLCGSTLATPNLSVNESGEVSFENIDGADSYKAYLYSGSEFIIERPITSGQKVWTPYLAGEYAIYVRAFNSSTNAYSDFSNCVIWDAAANPSGELPKSTMCGYYLKECTDEEAMLSFQTDNETGNFIISLTAGANGDDSKTLFRNAGGLALSGFTYNGNPLTDYFTRIPADDSDINEKVNVLTFVPRTDEGHMPEFGSVITFASGHYITWMTYNNGTAQTNAYGNNFSFSYVYGTNCNELDDHIAAEMSVTKISTTTTSATLQINVTDENDYGDARELRSLTVCDAANNYAEHKVTLNASNQVTLEGLTKNTIYNFTVKAVDSGGNVTEQTIKVPLTFDTEDDLAYRKPCNAGAVQNANTPEKAVNGNADNFWTSFGQGDASKAWWYVDLGLAYDLDHIKIHFNDIEGAYTIWASLDCIKWTAVVEAETASQNAIKEYNNINYSGRYLKVTCANINIGIREFEVYGTGFSVPDAVNPVVALSEISKTYNTVTLQIIATDEDNAGDAGTINAINITGDNGFVARNNVTLDENNQITLSGLHYNKTYTFTVQAIDLAGNSTSENIVVTLPFNTNYNIALDGTATAGYSENGTHTPDKANDGNKEAEDSEWNSYGVDGSVGGYANNWWQVQLDNEYNLRSIKIVSEEAHNNQYILEGSLDGSTFYKLGEGTITAVGTDEIVVSAPARYMRFTCSNAYCAIYEFEVYASGFSTLTDAQPVITWTKVGTIDDASAEIEIDAVDITTKPITKYMVSGIEENPIEVTASEGKIVLTSLAQSRHYTVTIQAKDESDNLSEGKQVEFTTAGSVSGLYFFSDYFSWNNTAEAARFSTTAEPGVLSMTISNMTAGGHTFKLYNAGADRCTRGNCSGTTDYHFANATAKNVTFYATDEDHFICTEDALYLSGALVGEDQALVWNDAHTVVTWTGALDLGGTKLFNVVKKNVVGETTYTYTNHFYTEAQTFDGDYTYGTFTLDLTKMTGTWSYVALSFADDAANNTSIVADNDGRIANVTINRGLINDGYWYTLCLPFDMSAEQMTETFGTGYTLAMMTGAEDRGSLIHLNFDYVNELSAGKPYLFKPGNKDFTAGSIIEGVTIKNADPSVTPQKSENVYMHFQGTFNKQTFTAESNPDVRFLADDNYLLSPANDGSDVGAFRCYFTIPASSPAPGRAARIVVGAQVPTEIGNVETGNTPCTKVLREGQLLILRDGRTYNAQGIMVKSE